MTIDPQEQAQKEGFIAFATSHQPGIHSLNGDVINLTKTETSPISVQYVGKTYLTRKAYSENRWATMMFLEMRYGKVAQFRIVRH